jgi:Common central domain of tyrosinase/Polyphenol oxidase middle domain
MKKAFFFFMGTAAILIAILSFVSINHTKPVLQKSASVPIACSAIVTYDVSAKKFVSTPSALMIRKNIYSLSAAEITSIKTGITAMKALPYTNNNSWLYQAAIHGTYLTDHLPSWNMCQHGTQFFLSWHRMYLYFFERILRAKSGNPNLTLPYWDYQTNAVLHPDYRDNTPGNPLYAVRSVSINAGGSLPAAPMTAINTALDKIPFFDFQTFLEGPHGSLHGAIGGASGDMSDIKAAAKDPVFWLHHGNIDRLWEYWLSKCDSRANPTSPASSAWMTQVFTFFDETGAAVNMTGSQVVNTASSLNYRYDVPSRVLCLFPYRPWLVYKIYPLLRWPDPEPIVINDVLIRKSFTDAKHDVIENFMKDKNKRTFNFLDKEKPDRLFIEIDNLSVKKQPEGVIEVYLNLGPNEVASPKSKSFVGVLDLFSASHQNMNMAGMKGMEKHTLRINADKAASALGLTIADISKASVSFVVRGNNLQGREMKTSGDVRLGGLNFALEMIE